MLLDTLLNFLKHSTLQNIRFRHEHKTYNLHETEVAIDMKRLKWLLEQEKYVGNSPLGIGWIGWIWFAFAMISYE